MLKEKAVSISVEVSGLPEALALAEHLEEKMKSVKTLAGELADLAEKLSVNIKESGCLRAICDTNREVQSR